MVIVMNCLVSMVVIFNFCFSFSIVNIVYLDWIRFFVIFGIVMGFGGNFKKV